MSELTQGAILGFEQRPRHFRRAIRADPPGKQALERELAPGACVEDAMDDRHAAPPELLEELVPLAKQLRIPGGRPVVGVSRKNRLPQRA